MSELSLNRTRGSLAFAGPFQSTTVSGSPTLPPLDKQGKVKWPKKADLIKMLEDAMRKQAAAAKPGLDLTQPARAHGDAGDAADAADAAAKAFLHKVAEKAWADGQFDRLQAARLQMGCIQFGYSLSTVTHAQAWA